MCIARDDVHCGAPTQPVIPALAGTTKTKNAATQKIIRAIMPHEFMKASTMTMQTKIIGASGQISLGKQYAGQHVMIEEIEPGEWRIQAAITIPKSQAWVHAKDVQATLDAALTWAAKTPPKATALTTLANKLRVARGRSK